MGAAQGLQVQGVASRRFGNLPSACEPIEEELHANFIRRSPQKTRAVAQSLENTAGQAGKSLFSPVTAAPALRRPMVVIQANNRELEGPGQGDASFRGEQPPDTHPLEFNCELQLLPCDGKVPEIRREEPTDASDGDD